MFTKTISAQNSNKSGNQMLQKTKTESVVGNKIKGKPLGSNRIFTRAKESLDKHVTIDLYQAVYGDDSSTSNKPATISQSDLQNEYSKSMQNINTQYHISTVPVSSNTSKVNSPTRKRNSNVPQQHGALSAQYNQMGNFKIPSSKYSKSSMYKTRNTKVKANTII